MEGVMGNDLYMPTLNVGIMPSLPKGGYYAWVPTYINKLRKLELHYGES